FVKVYADLGGLAREAIERFHHEVQEGTFPSDEHCF
ncbi:MAG: 3-methyl-2-oxobutanoate hydroxymethyltransferase, partial [bacterium]